MARPDSSYPPAQEFNPYTSPEAELGRLPESANLAPVEFSIGDVLSRAWTVYQGRMGFCVAVILVGFAVSIVAQVVNVGIVILGTAIPDPITMSIPFFVLYVLLFVFSIWIGMGQWLTYLRIAKGQPATMGDLFGVGLICSRQFSPS